MIEGLLNSAAPLILAGLGALVSDLSGTLGIFVEGFMVSGAFFSWVFAGWAGSVFWGTAASALLAAASGWALARFVAHSRANPFIAGLALNLAASGIALSLSAAWYGTKGTLLNPGIKIPDPVIIPLVCNIPFIGTIISGQSPFAYLALACAIITAIFLKKTVPGLRLRASGLSPETAAERGLRPGRYRDGAWAAAAFLAALAGASLTFRVASYSPGGVAGRGWIALALVYLGFRKVGGVTIAALVFILAERIGYRAQGLGSLPATALLGLPYALALLFYIMGNYRRQK